MFLEISQDCLSPAALLKKIPWNRCFPVNFAKFLRAPFLQNTPGQVLLKKSQISLKIQNFISLTSLLTYFVIALSHKKGISKDGCMLPNNFDGNISPL